MLTGRGTWQFVLWMGSSINRRPDGSTATVEAYDPKSNQ